MSAQPSSNDLVLTAARTVPFLVAMALALMRTKAFSDSQFLEPALSALKEVEQWTKPAAKGLVLCNEMFVKPFVDFTITRIQIAGYLISLLIGLASLIPIAISQSGYLGTTALSMFLYCICFMLFFGHLVVIQKEVFAWSTSVLGKLLTASVFGYVAIFLADKVEYLDLYVMVYRPYTIVHLGQQGDFTSLHLIIIVVAFLILFPFLRALKRSRWPSLGTRLDEWTRDGREFTADEAFNELNSKDRVKSNRPMFPMKYVQSQIDELIYRDKLVVIVRQSGNGCQCPMKPGDIRYKKK